MKYSMKNLMQEADFNQSLNKILEGEPSDELEDYIFSLKFNKSTKQLTAKIIMPIELLAEGLATVISAQNIKIEDADKFTKMFYTKVMTKIKERDQE